MRLPGGQRAIVQIEKLWGYCLNLNHPRGRHKARVFASRLGWTAEHAEEARAALLLAAKTQPAEPLGKDAYGQRFVVEFVARGPRGPGHIRSIWIIRRGEDFPRLVTCHVI